VPAQPEIILQGLAAACAFAALGAGVRLRRADLAAPLALLFAAALAVRSRARFPHRPGPMPCRPLTAHRSTRPRQTSGATNNAPPACSRRVPAWGILRAIPLGGCVVLGFAIVASSRPRPSAKYRRS